MAAHSNGRDPRQLPEPQGSYAHIVGWGMAVPDQVLTNQDLAAIVETSDEWIRTRTGVRERRIAASHESTSTLGLRAARNALEVANILPLELELIIVATSTPDNVFPSTASLIQDQLGATRAGAFDLSAACAGFVYALNMAAQSIRSGSIDSALVIGSETMSRIIDWRDRSICVLFGDGAGAVVLKASETEGGIRSAVLRSDGSGRDLLSLPAMVSPKHIWPESSPAGTMGHKMHMNGREVYRFATRIVGESISQALEKAQLDISDLSLIVPHQANFRIIEAAARNLGVSTDIFISNLERYGNTSAASIPIALCEAIDTGRIKEGDHIAFCGFGGGLAWAAMVLTWTGRETGEPRPLGRQRRQLSYANAGWRRRVRHWERQMDDLVSSLQPRRGRLRRLRRRFEQQKLE
jgi:3-oxoacyl-[acyl-carrier-protein] synthase-3